MAGALDGIVVVDLSEGIAGSYCTKLLAGIGAEVIKVERPGVGDPVRAMAPFKDDVPGLETSTVYVNSATPGNSYFTYTSGTWKLNWQTKPPVTAGCYNIRVILGTTGQTNGPFLIRLR